jgi:hypothetical protein
MLNWLRLAFLYRTYNRTIKQNLTSDKKRVSKKFQTLAVILDYRLGVDKKHFKEIGSYFKIPKKNIKIMTFFQSPKQINDLNYNSSFSSKNISSIGVLNGVVSDFCSQGCDVLINFYDQDDVDLKYISAKTHKKLSIGFKSVDHALNDLIIEVDAQNIEVFVSECIKYLEIFFNRRK